MLRKFRGYGFLKNLRFFDPFLVLFFREMGLSYLQIGGLISIREFAVNVLEVPTGVIADVVGRKRAMLVSFGSYLVAFVVFYVAARFGAYAAAMVMFAFGEAFRSGTHKAIILEHLRITGLEDRKTEYYGRTRAASQFGSAIAALIAAGIVFYAGRYRVVFLASTIPYLLGLLLIASYPRELDGRREKVPWKKRLRATLSGSLHLFRDRELIRCVLGAAGFDAVFKTTKDYIQPILQTQALLLPIALWATVPQRTAILVGGAFFLIYLATSFASSRAGRFERKVGETRALNGTYLGGLITLGIAGVAAAYEQYVVSVLAFFLLYVIQNIRRPVVVGRLSDKIPAAVTATGLSVEAQVRTIGMMACAPVLGWTADRWGVGFA
ncbi:MFS transporter, partial [Candidatus Bipolaricaulota bacterium]|nr:MFS transporter [Candidatus Bipolaricaulota bacterium]